MLSPDFDIDLRSDPQTLGNELLQKFNCLRDAEPVFWSETSQCWILSRHEYTAKMYKGELPLQHGGRLQQFIYSGVSIEELAARLPNILKYIPMYVINLDGQVHTRIRTLLMKGLNRRVIEAVRPYAKERINALLDSALSQESVEFNEEVARNLTGHVLFKLVGMPESRYAELKDWAIAIVEAFGAGGIDFEVLERADRAMASMNAVVLEELEKRRKEPTDDLLTSLLNATEDGDKLTVDELLAQLQIVIVAGHDTTANTMTLGIEALSRHPEVWQYMYENPDKALQYVAEIQRYVAMSGGQALLANEDFEIGGKQIKKGQIVVGLIAGADRDPLAFQDPEKLDPTRDNRDSLVFAPGNHFCLGAPLARLQLTEFFSALVERASGVEVLDKELAFMPVFTFRGMYNLNVKFTPRVV